jgi:hypothetical protein
MKQKLSLWKTLSGALVIAAVAFAVGGPSGSHGELLQKLATPRSGEREVLPPEALFVLDFTRQHGVTSIALSKLLADDRFLTQPIVESIYPAVVLEKAAIYVSYVGEPLPAGCDSLKAQKRIRIARCR